MRRNYISSALLEAVRSDSWMTKVTKGKYTVEMAYDGMAIRCKFYCGSEYIGSWDSLNEIMNVTNKEHTQYMLQGISNAGYVVMEIREM